LPALLRLFSPGNSPGQIVIGGHVEAVDAALTKLAEQGVRKTVKLAVSVPSHTPLMREAANRLAEAPVAG
jgi:[acyl-carrier-protein] S-malonyltransferase